MGNEEGLDVGSKKKGIVNFGIKVQCGHHRRGGGLLEFIVCGQRKG